ncbi:MAG TPA: sodium-transporting two-sector ATPase [Candidatus Saccharimonadales bacterium]|nr:sodium-transporting two-sector ATPase [Candidatus Saccharimonadales bacterium]
MSVQTHFDSLVKSGHPVGEVVAVDKFIVRLNGLNPVNLHSLVLFADGSKGFVNQVLEDSVLVLHLGSRSMSVGTLAVVQHDSLVCRVGKNFVGRVVSSTGQPLDGKGPILADSVWPVFNEAPPLHARKLLEAQLESGVMSIDSIFPIVRGQRIAIIGDSKSGKTSLATQLTINQKNTGQVTVYCLIAKRKSDVDMLINKLETTDSLKNSVVVVSTMFDSLISTYLAPYVACSIAEYLWQKQNQDTIIIYDDLTSHAHAYREISLLSGVSPGRDSYPGDMFYAHSSLLERAGRLGSNGNCLTAIPLVLASGGDITAFLSTNIMSITDGQWILDMNVFRSGIRPAINIGLSVTRVGGVGHTDNQKDLAAKTLKLLAEYRRAEEFSRFGSELSDESKATLSKGRNVFSLITQSPTDVYSLIAQQLMLDIVLDKRPTEKVDVTNLKNLAEEHATKVKEDKDYKSMREKLKKEVVTEVGNGQAK